jgi:phage tail protein X
MTVFVGSRYATGLTSTVPIDGKNTQSLARGPSTLPQPRRYLSYVVASQERLDTLAYRVYGRSDFWWVIADANPQLVLTDPLVAGTLLRIPDARDVY